MNKKEEIKNNLIQLGYKPHEAGIYMALLELGEVTVGPLISKTGLHRQIVYNTLEDLHKKQLINKIIRKNRQHFSLANPNKFLEEAQKQSEVASELVQNLGTFTNALAFGQEVKIFEGVKGLQEFHYENILRQPKNTTLHFIGFGGKKWFEFMSQNNFLAKYEKIRMQKKIKAKFVTFESQRNEVKYLIDHGKEHGSHGGKEYRYLPENLASPVTSQIWHDRIDMVVYGEPVLVFEVKNPYIVENFNNYFESLWKIAKE
ncbi:MAG: helix-turn-helix domain-containing protein [Candidatus Buchananbacteria bacterium]